MLRQPLLSPLSALKLSLQTLWHPFLPLLLSLLVENPLLLAINLPNSASARLLTVVRITWFPGKLVTLDSLEFTLMKDIVKMLLIVCNCNPTSAFLAIAWFDFSFFKIIRRIIQLCGD